MASIRLKKPEEEALEALRQKLNFGSQSEVVRNAVDLLTFLSEEVENGGDVCVVRGLNEINKEDYIITKLLYMPFSQLSKGRPSAGVTKS